MSIFLILVIFGGVGFAATAFLGVIGGAHHGGHDAGGHHSGAHHAAGHHGHAGAHDGGSHAAHGHAHNHASDQHSNGSLIPWWSFISPIDIFAYTIGAGMAGLVLENRVERPLLILTIIAGAIAFNWLLVKPLMSFLMRFASDPAEGLESKLMTSCEAASRFDENGRGLVKLTIDGQVVQLLGILERSPETQELGVLETVCIGDRLLITEIDAARNQCRVVKTAEAFEAASQLTQSMPR